MLENAERERLGNSRQPEKPLIRLRVSPLQINSTLLIFRGEYCTVYMDILGKVPKRVRILKRAVIVGGKNNKAARI